MKKSLLIILSVLLLLGLSGCCMSHEWADATCTAPKTCAKCGKTEGEALGHTFADATCNAPKTCTVCSETEGEALGHAYDTLDDGIDFLTAERSFRVVCAVCGDVQEEWTQEYYSFVDPETHTFLFTGAEFAARLQNQFANSSIDVLKDVTCEFELEEGGKDNLCLKLNGEVFGFVAFRDANDEQMDASVENSRNICGIQLIVLEGPNGSNFTSVFQIVAREVNAAIDPTVTGKRYSEFYAIQYIMRNIYAPYENSDSESDNGVNYICMGIPEKNIQIMAASIKQ